MSRGSDVEQVADESVRVLELAFVEPVVQPELVRDVVDARVVRVHEAIAGRDQPDDSARRAPTTVLHPTNRAPRRWALVNPLLRNSDFVTTGTSRPRNAVWRCTSKGSGGRVSELDQRSTFSTSPTTSIRYPSTPCWAGVSPVQIEVSAVAVVDGTTVVIAPPVIPASVGKRSLVLLERVPAEPVEDEQHHGRRVARDLRNPVTPRPPTSAGRFPRPTRRRAQESTGSDAATASDAYGGCRGRSEPPPGACRHPARAMERA